MRVEDIYGYNKPTVIMEAPYGIGQNISDTVKSGAKGLIGGGQEEAGNKHSGKKANELFKKFKTYAGRVGLSGQEDIDATHLVQFLKSQNINSAAEYGEGQTIDTKTAQEDILKAVQKNAEFKGGKKQQAPKAQPAPAQEQGEPIQKAAKPITGNSTLKQISQLDASQRERLIQLMKGE